MGKDRRIFGKGGGNGDGKPVIWTPRREDNKVFVFNRSDGTPVYVTEIPRCFYAGFPLCLSTYDKKDVPKVMVMRFKFRDFYNAAIEKMGSGL